MVSLNVALGSFCERLQRYGIDAELQIASAYETRLTDQSVDVVFCMSVLHHLQLDRVKNEIRRILKPDGLFILKKSQYVSPGPWSTYASYFHPEKMCRNSSI